MSCEKAIGILAQLENLDRIFALGEKMTDNFTWKRMIWACSESFKLITKLQSNRLPLPTWRHHILLDFHCSITFFNRIYFRNNLTSIHEFPPVYLFWSCTLTTCFHVWRKKNYHDSLVKRRYNRQTPEQKEIHALLDVLSLVTYAHTFPLNLSSLLVAYCNYTPLSKLHSLHIFFRTFWCLILVYFSCAVQKHLLLLTDARTTTTTINIVYSFSNFFSPHKIVPVY